ncbi:MAG: hypothetical protein KKC30_12405 [Proteobacteria bacterium]|nr:hypothetical protein [Pseudomonadota bacterium]MBU4384507.1 hypothetical protein [Pseudomonadota bacterium]MBU4605697.1 hypothetical protein [Pseudomonadota bacterium]MCG2766345.1 hypothetical protein [Desulfarculaceae bacterium]
MFEISQSFNQARRDRGEKPVLLFSLVNAFGQRVYAARRPQDAELGLAAPTQADGQFLADGARLAGRGSLSLLERSARVLSLGRLRETLTATSGEVLASLRQEEADSLAVTLANDGGALPFSRLEARENILGAVGELLVGWPGIPGRDYLRRFRGRVSAYRLEETQLTLTLQAL